MALYHVRVTMPAGRDLVTTGKAVPRCDARQCVATVAAGPQRDFAMAVVQGWQQVRRTVGDAVVVSSFPASSRAAGEHALALAADAIARYDKTFGAYPYTEFDVLPIPATGFAGVEYPGLIMINDQYYADPANSRIDLQDVVVHEVAHQWWYNVVGNDQLREPWLDEGLTSYTGEYLYTEWSGAGAKPVTERRRAALAQLHLDKMPIDGAVDSYSDAGAYVAVIYGRAPLFFDALRRELGDATFFNLLREYYKRYAFHEATTQGFERLVDDVAGRRLDAFFAAWIRRKPG
jgi:aminopeptidase N